MQGKLEEFNDAGVAVAAVTYDSVEQNAKFKSAENLDFSLLSDQGFNTVKNFGILNETHKEGDFAYGVGHPGVFLIDTDNKIVLKRAEERYSNRPSMDELLEAVTEFTGEATPVEDKTEQED